jgi:AcrR family transcriptional regulator
MRRTKAQAQATREQLLAAAERLFLERGLAATSLQDIARAAGVTRGAVYWHFADKVALAEALFERVDLPMEQVLAEAEREVASDPLAQLRNLAGSAIRLIRDDAPARRAFTILLHSGPFIGELAPLARRHDESLNDCLGRMERLFAAAMAAGQLRRDITPRQAVTALFGLVDGLLRLCTVNEPAIARCDEAERAIALLFDGLLPRS